MFLVLQLDLLLKENTTIMEINVLLAFRSNTLKNNYKQKTG